MMKFANPKIKWKTPLGYFRSVLDGGRRSSIGENYIIKYHAELVVPYCKKVIKNRWPKAEKQILSLLKDNSAYCYCAIDYAAEVIQGRWPELELLILNHKYFFELSDEINDYVEKVIKGRWIEAEEKIIKHRKKFHDEFFIDFLIRYAEVSGERWQWAEQIILNNGHEYHACRYAIDVIKDRWIEAEEKHYLCDDDEEYVGFIKNKIKNLFLEKKYEEVIKYFDFPFYSNVMTNLSKKHAMPDIIHNSLLCKSLAGDELSKRFFIEQKKREKNLALLLREMIEHEKISENSTAKEILLGLSL